MTDDRRFGQRYPITAAIFRWVVRRYVGDRPKHSSAYLKGAARDAAALGCREMERFLATRARLAEVFERLDP